METVTPLSGVTAYRYQQSLSCCITCQDFCVQRSHAARRRISELEGNMRRFVAMLLLHNKDQQQNNSRTFRSRFSQPAPAGKGADMMNCKLTTAWHENIEPVALVQSVISAKKTAIARNKSINRNWDADVKFSRIFWFLVLISRERQMPVLTPYRQGWIHEGRSPS